jgi:hypothetical protein
MRWTVRWSDVCEGDVRRMPWPLAARICGAVLELAESGRGSVEQTTPGDPHQLRVRVNGAAALVRLDVETRTLSVWRIYAT